MECAAIDDSARPKYGDARQRTVARRLLEGDFNLELIGRRTRARLHVTYRRRSGASAARYDE
jgi:hypothetical protein